MPWKMSPSFGDSVCVFYCDSVGGAVFDDALFVSTYNTHQCFSIAVSGCWDCQWSSMRHFIVVVILLYHD